MRLLLVALAMMIGFQAVAEPSEDAIPLKVMKRWVVFPFQTPSNLRTNADNAWWKVRERITNTKKYLVASKNFLVEKDVYYPRKKLSSDDIRLLSNLLEADVIVTGYSEGREFVLNVFLAQNGELFWSKELFFHPSQKPGDQLEAVADKLIKEFLNAMPYQGFTVVDPLIKKPVYIEGNRKFSIIEVGQTEDFKVGMDVEWMTLKMGSEAPVISGLTPTMVAEGKITKIRKGSVVAEVLRTTSIDLIQDGTLVRFPKASKIDSQAYVKEAEKQTSEPTPAQPTAVDTEGKRRSTMVFGSVLSFLGVLLLTF